MGTPRAFRDVKLQWLQQLSCDKDLSDNARSVALYIVTTHLNGHTGKAWPSYQTIAEATGKSVKTIQRAIRELETSDWFEIRRGNGIGHNTEYRPSAVSILRASDARKKTDKVVTLYLGEGGQNRLERRSDVSGEGGQICPPNPEKEKIYKPNPREDAPPRVASRRPPRILGRAQGEAGRALARLAAASLPPIA
ncbi:helix-turn-helix domain-containing protein [Endobacterium cereale]|uniref:helix-turn-helix domain-containing protein n=1 Tax=Endobacterium cereale TaxID=2663029 RepID=UPI001F2874B3|nr:helix-turn-helix domain-containing protein [Endobacterium cereale]